MIFWKRLSLSMAGPLDGNRGFPGRHCPGRIPPGHGRGQPFGGKGRIMPWIIGIDEAGYGPNLGPLVMTSVACRVPDCHAEADLWHLLRAAVRRPEEKDDGRLLVGDSKIVYSSTRGLAGLEGGVLAALAPC